jgi:hypothetical protein
MKGAALVVLALAVSPGAAAAQSVEQPGGYHFAGPAAQKMLCECLADARQMAEREGRLDFSVNVESTGSGANETFTARIVPGIPYAVGRINFTGHSRLDDTTLRRAMLLREHELLDLRRLRRSIDRINDVGMFDTLTLDDVRVDRLKDGVTVDVTITLHERKRRWWSLSSPLIPGVGGLQAMIAWRLPPWGRGLFTVATSFISLNVIGFAPPVLALELPIFPGHQWLSGFIAGPQISLAAMLRHYGRTHAIRAIDVMLDAAAEDSFNVPITPMDPSSARSIACQRRPVAVRWLWHAATSLLGITKGAL